MYFSHKNLPTLASAFLSAVGENEKLENLLNIWKNYFLYCGDDQVLMSILELVYKRTDLSLENLIESIEEQQIILGLRKKRQEFLLKLKKQIVS